MNRIHRRVKTGTLAARALDNTFTGTVHIVILVTPYAHNTRTPGNNYEYQFASLDGPNGFPGNTGRVVR